MFYLLCLLSLFFLFILVNKKSSESFQDDSESEADNMNKYYRLLLHYVQSNPDKSIEFINSIQQKFCTDKIDFKNLSDILPVFI